MTTIPGRLDAAALEALADDRARYRPSTPGGRRRAVLELHRQGLTARDIAQALRLSLAEVLEVLRAEAERRAIPPTRAPDYSRKAWVRYLAAQGCDYDEIAAALALDPAEVLRLLEPPEGAP
jgi:SOS response regulatory protein OraA/RecX